MRWGVDAVGDDVVTGFGDRAREARNLARVIRALRPGDEQWAIAASVLETMSQLLDEADAEILELRRVIGNG